MLTLACAVLLLPAVVPAEPTDASQEYAAKLSKLEPTADAQFRLAVWAKKAGMKDVAEGHLRAAVHLDPNNALAQKALRRSLRDGRWETKEERKERLDREDALRTEFARLLPRLKEVGLEAVTGRPLSEAVIAAVEQYTSVDKDRSLEAVAIFGDCDQGTTTMALVRQAVASQFPVVRTTAARALRSRNPDHCLPVLLDYVRSERRGRLLSLSSNQIWCWQDGSTIVVATPAYPFGQMQELVRRVPRSDVKILAQHHHDNMGLITLWAFVPVPLPNQVEKHFSDVENHHANAITAIQAITGKTIGDDFSAWREVVMEMTNSHIDHRTPTPTSTRTVDYQPEPGRLIWLASCFAAGTPVVTKRGVVPIDQVCVGELVLSRNVETGETAYKPVLARTLRPRVPMRKLTVGDETLHATAGHPFWTPDKGWTKAKNLSEGLSLGLEDGEAKLSAVADAVEPQQAYNLVVADFGTYFVGKSRILVHDNTPIRDAPAKGSK